MMGLLIKDLLCLRRQVKVYVIATVVYGGMTLMGVWDVSFFTWFFTPPTVRPALPAPSVPPWRSESPDMPHTHPGPVPAPRRMLSALRTSESASS